MNSLRVIPTWINSRTLRRTPRYAMPGVDIYAGALLVRDVQPKRKPILFEIQTIDNEG